MRDKNKDKEGVAGAMASETGKLGKIFGLIIFISLSFLVALMSVWFLVIKNQPDIVAAANQEISPVNSDADTTNSSVLPSDTLYTDIADTASYVPMSLADKQKEWEKFKREKLRSYLEILKRKAQEEDANLAMIKKLSAERDSLNQAISKVASERDEWKKQLEEYKKSIAEVVADEVVAYYKKRDAEKDSLERVQKQKELAANGTGIRKLAKIYESMRPEQAAPVLAKLKDSEIINILFKMRQRNAAKIIANFDPQLAARITRKMSGK